MRVDLQVSVEPVNVSDPVPLLELVPELVFPFPSKGVSLFTRCPFPFLQIPLQFIQHPLCFKLSSMNHTVNRKTEMNTAGTIRRAPLTVTLTNVQTSQNKKLRTTPASA